MVDGVCAESGFCATAIKEKNRQTAENAETNFFIYDA
jgi:hypothetical protein